MITPELAPLAKVGGLGDMVASLSKELGELGHDVRVVLPLYGHLKDKLYDWQPMPTPLAVRLGAWRELFCRVWQTTLAEGKVSIFLLEHDQLFNREGIYAGPHGDYNDNHLRFAFMNRAALDLCYACGWMPDVVHGHDWTAGFAPGYLSSTELHQPLGRAASVYTIHNLQHQGWFGRDALTVAGLPDAFFKPDHYEADGGVNLMKGAIYHATRITTVSPTYAREIQESTFGCGLNHVLKLRSADLTGVLNGIDTTEWNPATDPHIAACYDKNDLTGKAACKAALQRRFGLAEESSTPLYGVIARLYDQKGLDLLAAIMPSLMEEMSLQLVLLGAGDSGLENTFRSLAKAYPSRIGVHIGYDNALSHQIEAGSDFFIMPSRFEPCGLNQLYSMRYGTVPVVRATGGLADTVEPYIEGKGQGTGFIFKEPAAKDLFFALGRANAVYYDRPGDFQQLRLNGMMQDFSWGASARIYERVYREAVAERTRRLRAPALRETALPRVVADVG